jgi:hypothetical protein
MSTTCSNCASHCREMAEATYDLASRAELPEIIGDLLNVAGKLLACADPAEAEKTLAAE